MAKPADVGVGIIGLGFIGSAHFSAYQRAQQSGLPARIVGVCDPRLKDTGAAAVSADRPHGNIESALHDLKPDWSQIGRHSDATALLRDERIRIVSICTPTETHVDLAIAALHAGKHVLVEKPVALAAGDVRRLIAVAERFPGQHIMPALCMRYWPGWDWLREKIASRVYGDVRSATFQRLGTRPAWSALYADDRRTGGALVDLHLHDADFVRWCFGNPDAVFSGGSSDHLTTIYRYSHGPRHVTAEGAWDHAGGWPFRMKFTVVFENATAEFDSGRDEPLRLSHDGQTHPVALDARNGWEHEIRAFVSAVANDGPAGDLRATLADAEGVARLLECERRSMETGAVLNFG